MQTIAKYSRRRLGQLSEQKAASATSQCRVDFLPLKHDRVPAFPARIINICRVALTD